MATDWSLEYSKDSLRNQDNNGNNAAAQSGGDDDDDGNRSNQGIGQDQDSEQNSQCVSGEDATVSCNNVSFQNQVNSGNNALAQQDWHPFFYWSF